MSQPDSSQIKELEAALHDLNALLEKILHIQFGIQDEAWLDAIQTIEDGYAKAIAWVTKHTRQSH